MTTRIDEIAMKTNRRHAVLCVALMLALGGCQKGSTGSVPKGPATLQALTIAPGPPYLAVGAAQQLTATGHYSDGSSAAVASGLQWQSSDGAVASVDAAGLVSAVAKGSARITATHSSGVAGTADLTSRVAVTLAFGQGNLPRTGSVDTTSTLYRITGLTPGAFYTPGVSELDDDVDLAVYSDASLSAEAQACASQTAGTVPESCTAPASAAGELYLAVDGSWTEEGSSFKLVTVTATPVVTKAVLAFPAQLPVPGTVDRNEVDYKVTGLTAGESYVVRISGLTDDADLEVYSDAYLFASACSSYKSGKVDDFCTAAANAAGELFVEVDGGSTANGASFTLAVTPAK